MAEWASIFTSPHKLKTTNNNTVVLKKLTMAYNVMFLLFIFSLDSTAFTTKMIAPTKPTGVANTRNAMITSMIIFASITIRIDYLLTGLNGFINVEVSDSTTQETFPSASMATALPVKPLLSKQ